MDTFRLAALASSIEGGALITAVLSYTQFHSSAVVVVLLLE